MWGVVMGRKVQVGCRVRAADDVGRAADDEARMHACSERGAARGSMLHGVNGHINLAGGE
jgi:hypothetical protein